MPILLDNLNQEQKEAVTHKNGPLLIIAGAGTGKTTVITKKIAWLIEQGLARPDEILALTFTDKAAGEMEERVDRLLPYGYVDLWISTFHSFCERILKERGIEIGLPEFKLLSVTDQWMLLRKNLDKLNLDYYRPMGNPTKFLHALLTHFSRAKDELISPEEYLEHAKNLKLDGDSAELVENEKKKTAEVAEAYHIYNQLLLEEGALDFGDLINYTLKLFKTRPKILKEYRDKFKYILVDEFQDTNFAQYELVKILAAGSNNLTVVGDDDQSIFRFRGASMSNILIFDKDYPEAKKIVLIKNYRSGQKILDASYNFIKLNNPNRLEVALGEKLSKKLESQAECSGEVEMLREETLDDEIKAVMQKIVELKNQNQEVSWNDFAILVRANESAKPFMRLAELSGIPYQFLASRGLYNKRIIIEVLSFFRLLDNYREGDAMFRFLLIPIWNLKPEDVADINYHAKKKAISLYEACCRIEAVSKDENAVKTIKIIISFLEKMQVEAKIKKPSQVFLKMFTETGYLEFLNSQPDSMEKLNTFNYLKKFHKKIKEYETENESALVRDFMEYMNLELDSGDLGALPADADEGPEMVKILTIHSAKGLEFKYVFVVNLVDKRFPTTERRDPIELPKDLVKEIVPEGDIHLEEERRLFYVAMTRAKEKLFLACAKDYGGAREKKPSRFLYEMGLLAPETKNKVKKNTTLEIEEKKETAEQFLYSLPKQFSYSQIKAYETCPCQYKMRFLLGVPTEDSFQASFGRSIHSALENFFTKIKESAGKSQTDLFGTQEKKSFPSLDELKNIYDESWIDDWYESQDDMLKNKERGWRALKEYYEGIKPDVPDPLYLEQEFVIKFGEDSFKGVIDRIDRLPNGNVVIWDYKTGAAKEKLDSENKEQLLIYYLACRDIFNLKPEKLVLFYILDNKKFEFAPTEADLEKIKEKVSGIINEIKKLHFEPSPDEHTCRFCDYKNICEFKK
ncbi:MAG: ATP-dependent DNA helicase [Patescibacteria group bacterium]